ncbi:hypothetical protein [Cylindrospermum stagnale]|uniref:hypothetical protein n=1 Tax=Cylindrospermum stagnale TaxID=142864 RepID=UPI0002FA0514|nr:hypothetical protein [Cylindrospermum stagnale]
MISAETDGTFVDSVLIKLMGFPLHPDNLQPLFFDFDVDLIIFSGSISGYSPPRPGILDKNSGKNHVRSTKCDIRWLWQRGYIGGIG